MKAIQLSTINASKTQLAAHLLRMESPVLPVLTDITYHMEIHNVKNAAQTAASVPTVSALNAPMVGTYKELSARNAMVTALCATIIQTVMPAKQDSV